MKTALVLSVSLAAMLVGCADQCDPKTFAARCDGNKAVTCPEPGVDQVVPNHSTTVDCGSGACVATGGTAFCALSATADPRATAEAATPAPAPPARSSASSASPRRTSRA